MSRTCDPKCYELAQLFLEDAGLAKTPQVVYELAGYIQETIEDYIVIAKKEANDDA
jgi:hypothetical protein